MRTNILSIAKNNFIPQDLDFVPSTVTCVGIIKAIAHEWPHCLAQTIASQVIPQNPAGFTFDPLLNKCLVLGRNTNPGIYIVSIKDHGLRLPRIPTEQDLSRWITGQLELLLSQGNYIGGWPYLGDYFLDVSVLIHGKGNALSFARANEQLTIFHPASDENICVRTEVVSSPTPAEQQTGAELAVMLPQ